MKRVLNLRMLYFGTPVVLVSSLNDDGTTNIAPMSSAWWAGDTAMLGMSANSQTVRNLQIRPACVLNLADASMVAAVDRLALLTGRSDVPAYKLARGYRHEPEKFAAAGLTAQPLGSGLPAGVAEAQIRLEGRVLNIYEIDEPGSGLRALEVSVTRTHVDQSLLMDDHPDHVDPLRWDPLIMKFAEYFAGAGPSRASALARGWNMPSSARIAALTAPSPPCAGPGRRERPR